MSKNKKNVPEIRFPGFTDAWEQRKLVDFVEDYVEKTAVQNQYPVLTSSQKQGIVFQEEYFADRQVTTNNNIGYFVLPRGYFTFRSRTDNGIFSFNRNNIVDKGIISYFYPVFSIKNGDSDFFLQMMNNSIKRQVDLAAEGTGQRVLSLKKFKAIDITVPELEEQRRIGEFFCRLEKNITLHQRKLEDVKKLKKGLLQKMFPKKGEVFPEIRFPGFTDAWEQRRLGEIANIVGGGTPSTTNKEYWEGDIDWYSPVEIGEESYIYSSQRKITNFGLQNSSAKILPIGTVLFTSRAGIGNTAILAREGATNQGFQSIVPDKNQLDSYFIYSRTDELKRYGETMGAGSTFKEVSGKQMTQMPMFIPSLEEQIQIGNFFKQIDDAITLHQRKLNHLKEQKKTLLRKMFV